MSEVASRSKYTLFCSEPPKSADCVDNFDSKCFPRRDANSMESRRCPPSSAPIFVPKTVPLYLESTNDVLPDSPSLKFFQISPDRKTFTFPEVTFSNLLALNAKNRSKDVTDSSSELNDDGMEDSPCPPKPKSKSGSIPSDFVYSDGAFSGKTRSSLTNSDDTRLPVRDRSPVFNSEESIDTIPESPECRDKTGRIFNFGNRSSLTDETGNNERMQIELSNPETPKVVVTDPNACTTPIVSSTVEESSTKTNPSSLNHSASSPSLPSKNTHPNHQCKKPGPVVHTEPPRRHRHSVAGHHNFKQNLSYFKLYGISVGPTGIIFNQSDRTKNKLLGSTSSLFSTAVISGSSSAPNLRDGISNNTTVSAIEGYGGVPPIRPLETLHNALSLKQLDLFLEKMTAAPLYRTPTNTPPHLPSTPQPSSHPLGNVYWSGASSLVSSSGPSSPNTPSALGEMSRCNTGEALMNFNDEKYNYLRKMSSSGSLVCMFPQTPGLDEDLGSIGILLESSSGIEEQCLDPPDVDFSRYSRESQENDPEMGTHCPGAGGPDSGELTPVSVSSEFEYHHHSESDFESSIRPKNSSDQVASTSKQRETEMRLKEFFNLSKSDESEMLDSEMIKKKFDGKLRRLDIEEEDEGDKTITTVMAAPRESIVGFFKDDKSAAKESEESNPLQ